MASEFQLLLGPLTKKSYLLDGVSHFGPQRHQCFPKNAPEEHQIIWLKKINITKLEDMKIKQSNLAIAYGSE